MQVDDCKIRKVGRIAAATNDAPGFRWQFRLYRILHFHLVPVGHDDDRGVGVVEKKL